MAADNEDLRGDLDDWMAGGEDAEYPAVEYENDVLASAIDADRLLRRIRQRERELQRLQALYDEERRKLDSWLEDRTHGPKNEIGRMEQLLEQFARAQHAASAGRTVSWKLPNGTLKLTSQRESIVVDDPVALAGFISETFPENAGELVTVDVRAGEVKKLIDAMDEDAKCECGLENGLDRYCPVHGDRVYLRAHYAGAIVPGVHLEKPRQRGFSQTPPSHKAPSSGD